jgi:hypothetical protein
MNFIENIVGWPFMQEPLWRWFLFFGAVGAISLAWSGILDFMKA